MKIRQATLADKKVWDEYVAAHPNATAYHYFGWGQAVTQSYPHKACYLIAMEQDVVVGVLPIVHFKQPLRKNYLSSLPFCDLGGCLSDSPEIHQALMMQAEAQLKQTGSTHLEYRGCHSSSEDKQDMEGQKVRMLLDLPGSSEQLWNGFKSKLRSQVRKAEKNGLTVKVGADEQLLKGFYQVFRQNMRDLGSPVHSEQWFEALLENYQGKIVIANVYSDEHVVGGGIVLFTPNAACIPWASTVSRFNHLAPNMLLYWSLLEYVADAGVAQFDFGRSTFSQGTFRFKKQWGAQPHLLDWKTLDCQGNLNPVLDSGKTSSLRSTIEKVWQRLPLPITTWLGPKIRQFISL